MRDQRGFIAEVGLGLVVIFFVALFLSLFFVRFKASQSDVSGIVYNTELHHLVSGNTTFSVRAGIDTYVNQNNESDFCLPPHSPYTELVKKAAADKTIKVDVVANKYFAIQAPWTCKDNVTVTRVN